MRKRLPVLLGLLTPVALSSGARTDETNGENPFDPGTWIGVGHQTGGWTWEIELVFGPDTIEINYPSLECGGVWIAEADAVTGEKYYREKLAYGMDNCIDGGRVTISKTSEGLNYEWSDDEGEITATATLRLQENVGQEPRAAK